MSDSKEIGKPTPGPWSIPHFADEKSACGCTYIFSESQSGFGAIATVQFGGEDEGYKIAKANALLIAAAPMMVSDLVEAAQLLREYEKLHRAKGEAGHIKAERNKALVEQFEATIARARGLSQ